MPTTDPPQSDPRESQIIEDLRQVYAALQIVNLPTWLKLDVTMAQLKALVTVERAGEISVGGVADGLSIGESSASLLIEQLVRRGYAARSHDAADRRRVLVVVTELGEARLSELRHGRRQTLHEWLAEIELEDAAALAQGLAALGRVAAARTAVTQAREARP